MKNISDFLREELFATPNNTIGLGNPMASEVTGDTSGDLLCPMCIDIKTGKLYKRRKKFRRYKI